MASIIGMIGAKVMDSVYFILETTNIMENRYLFMSPV